VPDAGLNDVAWYALPDGEQRILDSDLEIHLLSAGRDLVRRRADAFSGPVLVLGGADFELRPAASSKDTEWAALRGSRRCEAFATRRFGRLPFSAREAQGVAGLARAAAPVIELEGRDAGEQAFVRSAPGASWIHAATHGFYVDRACRNPGWERDEEIAASAALEPMLYSGIALAGANRRSEAADAGQDGIVTAEEFARMDLSHVRGMVITGCDTGLGDYVTGEGVYGLRRALERAGVGSLTLALWPVEDQASARWALAFYDGLWRRGLSPATANRLAMRRVRQELKDLRLPDRPRLWAAFVDSGIAQ
jgi:CHAT domain-containing protein